jgi:glyceraldehyde-3-phosphate dehydrogenase type I
MAIRVAINGFGRTGRAAFRSAYERGADIEWVAINDVAEPAMLAQLLRRDTVYGPFSGRVESTDGAIVVDGQRIVVPSETDPARLPWQELGVDVVIESTGRFRARPDAEKHLQAGARKVIVSAPAKDPHSRTMSATSSGSRLRRVRARRARARDRLTDAAVEGPVDATSRVAHAHATDCHLGARYLDADDSH